MNTELRYFTGTGNSLKVLSTISNVFSENNHRVNSTAIQTGNHLDSAYLIGFSFPVYAFGIPRICRNYLKKLPPFKSHQKVFLLVTAGDADECGFAINEATKMINKKNGRLIYSAVIQMPINWTTSPTPPFPPDKDEAKKIIEQGIVLAQKIAYDLLNGISQFHVFNYPKRYGRVKFYSDYFMFKHLGISNLWRTFRVYENCSGCGSCAKICPTKSIKIINKKPVWSSTCEQCMRCVNYCENEAIYQTMGGDTKNKNKYIEPDFRPLN